VDALEGAVDVIFVSARCHGASGIQKCWPSSQCTACEYRVFKVLFGVSMPESHELSRRSRKGVPQRPSYTTS
jgi:hypothetical protein